MVHSTELGRGYTFFWRQSLAAVIGFLSFGFSPLAPVQAFGLFTGIGSSVLPSMLSSVPHWFTHGRSVMMGIISAGGGVGGLLIPLISNWLIEDYKWRTAYLILGISYLVITIIASQFLRRSPSGVKAADPGQTAVRSQTAAPTSLKEIFRSARFWLGNLVFFCLGFSAGQDRGEEAA